ncbi:MAG: DUF1653 domain-containing protein [Lachnospiraceae bacterium]|nr:DUF1653 domain-containing protein [Lachnospiraceae bacterium]
MERNVVAGEIYRHFKGKLYQIIGVAIHSETKEELVIYQALYGDFSMYARPLKMFLSKVDREKYPEVQQEYRFEKVDKKSLKEELFEEVTPVEDEVIKEPFEEVTPVEEEVIEKPFEEVTLVEEVIEEPFEEVTFSEETEVEGCNRYLMQFLEADTVKEKKAILVSIRQKIDDRLINDIAASLDIVIDEGPIDKRFMSLLNCLNTMSKFECDRFR